MKYLPDLRSFFKINQQPRCCVLSLIDGSINAQWRPLLAVSQDSGVSAPEAILDPGHSIQLHSAVVDQSKLDLRLLNYLAQDWQNEYRSVPCIFSCTSAPRSKLYKSDTPLFLMCLFDFSSLLVAASTAARRKSASSSSSPCERTRTTATTSRT